jgi:hypothetical protein
MRLIPSRLEVCLPALLALTTVPAALTGDPPDAGAGVSPAVEARHTPGAPERNSCEPRFWCSSARRWPRAGAPTPIVPEPPNDLEVGSKLVVTGQALQRA